MAEREYGLLGGPVPHDESDEPPPAEHTLLAYFLIDRHPRHLAAFIRQGGQIPDTDVWREIFAQALESDLPRAKPSRHPRKTVSDLAFYISALTERKSTGCTVGEAIRSSEDEAEVDLEKKYERGRTILKKIKAGIPIV